MRKGSHDLEMTVVLVPKSELIVRLFNKLSDTVVMSYDTFSNRINDPDDEYFMDIELLVNVLYPVDIVSDILNLYVNDRNFNSIDHPIIWMLYST